jgi:large subunit ribosomal protein L22
MEVKAFNRNLRMSARKVRLIAGLVRGMDVKTALDQLRFWRKAAALPIAKLIKSAMANAEHNFKLDKDNLYIKTITVDIGPSLKRWRARAFGRAAQILKHTCHVSLVLDERRVAAPKAAAAAVKTTAKVAASKPLKAAPAKPAAGEKKSKAKA